MLTTVRVEVVSSSTQDDLVVAIQMPITNPWPKFDSFRNDYHVVRTLLTVILILLHNDENIPINMP